MLEMVVDDMIQVCTGMSEKKATSCHVEAFLEQVGERLRSLEGDENDHVVYPGLVFSEQVTKLVDWRFLEFGRGEDETTVYTRARFLSFQVCEMERVLFLSPSLLQSSRVFDTLPFGS